MLLRVASLSQGNSGLLPMSCRLNSETVRGNGSLATDTGGEDTDLHVPSLSADPSALEAFGFSAREFRGSATE